MKKILSCCDRQATATNQPAPRPRTSVDSTTLSGTQTATLPKKPDKRDLWQEAFDGLDQESQDLLHNKTHASTEDTIQEVIENTKKAYEKHGEGDLVIPRLHGGHIRVRELAGNIIKAALEYKDIISAAAAFDPTRHGMLIIIQFSLYL